MALVGPIRRGRLVEKSKKQIARPTSALDVMEWHYGKKWPAEWDPEKKEDVPDVIEFTTSDRFADRPNLYPRQGTLLKIIFLQDELFTQYDHDVIGEWIETFRRTGEEGIQPDIYERIRLNKARGRPWFREIVSVMGRRGSKGHIGALTGAYVLWNYLALGDPQGHFGVDRDKRLTAITFAGKKEQAVANQWRDLNQVIRGAPCFAPYISKAQGERLTVYAPHDFARLQSLWRRGVQLEADIATFEVIAAPSTLQAGRGPTSFMQHYDEMAHVVATGANRDAEAVYDAATPALDQFKEWGFIYEGSSPWQMTGQFYTNWERSLETNEDGSPAYPEMLMIQLPSWAPYYDWERAPEIPVRAPRKIIAAPPPLPPSLEESDQMDLVSLLANTRPVERMERVEDIPAFRAMRGAMQEYDDDMKQLERANPETFEVERRAHWATVMDAYFNADRVAEIFKNWGGFDFESGRMKTEGILSEFYKAHGDPSKSGAGFGFAIGHTVKDENDMKHVVFDVLHQWDPANYPDHNLDYLEIEQDLKDYIDAFMPFELTFDQFNSVSPIAHLTDHVRKARKPKKTEVFEKTATAPLNWARYETFKTAVNLGFVHAPYFEIAELELRFLQDLGNKKVDHPTSGPVQTKDVADCMAEVVYTLIGTQMEEMMESLGGLRLGGSLAGGLPTAGSQANPYAEKFQDSAAGVSRKTLGERSGRPNARRPDSWGPAGTRTRYRPR